MLSKILSLTALGSTLSNINLTRKFVVNLSIVLGLTVMVAILASALVLFGLYEFREVLMQQAIEANRASLLSAMLGVVILAALFWGIYHKVNRLQAIPLVFGGARDMGATVMSVVRGFYRGLSDKSPS